MHIFEQQNKFDENYYKCIAEISQILNFKLYVISNHKTPQIQLDLLQEAVKDERFLDKEDLYIQIINLIIDNKMDAFETLKNAALFVLKRNPNNQEVAHKYFTYAKDKIDLENEIKQLKCMPLIQKQLLYSFIPSNDHFA